MNCYYFTTAGKKSFEEKIIEEECKLKHILLKKRETQKTEGSKNSFCLEQLTRDEEVVANRLDELRFILKKAIIVPSVPLNIDRVSIGSVVEIEHDGVFTKEYRVSGYGESDLGATPQKLLYLAPIISPFIGREVGHTCKVRLGKSKRLVNLTLVGLRTM